MFADILGKKSDTLILDLVRHLWFRLHFYIKTNQQKKVRWVAPRYFYASRLKYVFNDVMELTSKIQP